MNMIISGFMWGVGMLMAQGASESSLFGGVKQWCRDVVTVAKGEDKKVVAAPATHGQVVDFKTGETLQKGVPDA